MSDVWRLWVDSGGTFTDCLAIDPAGRRHRAKVLSSGALRARVESRPEEHRLVLRTPLPLPPGFLVGFQLRRLGRVEREGETPRIVAHHESGEMEVDRRLGDAWAPGKDVELVSGEEAPVLAARLVTGVGPGRPLPPIAARLASTRGTNALLEEKGSPTALFVTRGFADLLEIGNQQRPDLFALEIVKPRPLYREVVEVDERLRPDGTVLEKLGLAGVEEAGRALLARGIDAAAVALLHAYRNPRHERRLGERLRRLGFRHVSLSSTLSPRIKILGRAQTAVVDAYLSGVLEEYVSRVREGLGARSLHLLTSAGGLVRADAFHPKDSLLSGPAGGVLGAGAAGRRSGGERLLAFDMGGTSTDVSRWEGGLEYRSETEVGAARLTSNSVAVETVAAGGGSVCSFDGRQLKVGPESAGARPGPASYGAGGPLTLTDVNLLLGRIAPARFAFPVDTGAARAALEAVRRRIEESGAGREAAGAERVLSGFLRIANEKMAAAVRRSSVRRGFRPSDYWLVAFGGAGPQHGCALAALLGIDRVLVPPEASLLSAAGLGAARIERLAEEQILAPLDEVAGELGARFRELEREATEELAGEGVAGERVRIGLREAHLRFQGQEATLEVEVSARPEEEAMEAAFLARYEELFGYRPSGRRIEVERLRVLVTEAEEGGEAKGERGESREPGPTGSEERSRRFFAGGAWLRAPEVERVALEGRPPLAGPALVVEANSVTVVEPGWSARLDAAGGLVLERSEELLPSASEVHRRVE